MNVSSARRRFAAASIARLATVDGAGCPHIVPVTFALLMPDTIVTAVDHKPKRTQALKRLSNIAANPRVSLLVDHYEQDWSALWWVRADGRARVLSDAEDADGEPSITARDALEGRYPQYRDNRPAGPLIVIDVERWSGWAARE